MLWLALRVRWVQQSLWSDVARQLLYLGLPKSQRNCMRRSQTSRIWTLWRKALPLRAEEEASYCRGKAWNIIWRRAEGGPRRIEAKCGCDGQVRERGHRCRSSTHRVSLTYNGGRWPREFCDGEAANMKRQSAGSSKADKNAYTQLA